MSERHRIAAVVLGVALLLAVGAVGIGAADGHDAETNETESEDRLSPGERLAGTMGVQETELEAEVEKRSFEKALEGEDEQGQSDLASDRIEQLEADLADIEARADTLRNELEAGEITRSQFHSQIAQLRIEAESKADIAERAADVVDAELAEQQQELVATIVDLRVRASELVGAGDRAAVDRFIEPDVGASEEETDESDEPDRSDEPDEPDEPNELEAVADQLIDALQDADQRAQEDGTVVTGTTVLPEEVEGDAYTISVEPTPAGAEVAIESVERERGFATVLSVAAAVERAELRHRLVDFTVNEEEIVLDDRAAEDDEEAESEATEVANRIATTLEVADRTAHETDSRVTDRLDLPRVIDGGDYSVTVRPTDDGGIVLISGDDAGKSATAEFNAQSTVEDSRVSGGPTVYGANTEQVVFGEPVGDDRDDDREIGAIVDEFTAELEMMAQRAQEHDQSFSETLRLPETIDDQRYEIRVEPVAAGGEFTFLTADGTEIDSALIETDLAVESAQFTGGVAVTVTVDAERIAFSEREEDTDDAPTTGDASEIVERLAAQLEAGYARAVDDGTTTSGGLDLPPEIDGQAYTLRIKTGESGIELTVLDQDRAVLASAIAEVDVSAETTTFQGGDVVEFSVDRTEAVFREHRDRDDRDTEDDRDRDDHDVGDTDDRNHEAIELGDELADAFETSDERAQESGDAVARTLELPDKVDGDRYELIIEGQDDGGLIVIGNADGEELDRTTFSTTASVESDSFVGGETLAFIVDPAEFRFDEREDEDDEDEEDDETDRAELAMEIREYLASQLERTDREAHDEEQTVTRDVDLPDTLDGERYEITVRASDDGGSVRIASAESDVLYTADFGSLSEVQEIELSGGPISITADTERLVIEEQ